ncbi:hypothetical protein [Klenkia brasiliensis]|uniref:MinD-like ATPase involved in chromosome partitioning or flagellar assembly n=1 Tax=Klenkia brasiliensis TaxID=333142 RepID=A0A1G7SGV6_9ACTN|nr:hypothetical protein [Klenkia brasiliensis]SDG21450.1 hypothetical protein SAMN05660324_1994 [Klenkia brasiliensis]
MLIAVTSGKASPGVTTSVCALAAHWPRALLLADCDVAGGDIAPGLMAGRVGADTGLLSWSTVVRNGVGASMAASALLSHAVQVPEHPMLGLLPGFGTAAQGGSFTADTWERLAAALGAAEASLGRDVLVDSGRLVSDRGCWPVFRQANHVLLAARPSVRSVHAAQDAVRRIRAELGDLATVSVLVIGSGPYSSAEVAGALDLPLGGELPNDPGTAATLSDGLIGSRRALRRSPLMRAASGLAQQLAARHRASVPA